MAVNKPPAKRGRPKSAQTLEREKIEAWLKNPPAHIRLLTKKERQLLKDSFEASEKLRQNLLAGHSPLIPNELIYAVESIGDEAMEGYESATLKQYASYQAMERDAKRAGGKQLKSKANSKAEHLWKKNSALAKRAENGTLPLNSASENIHKNWGKKGVDGEKPSVKTISNWYKRIRPN